MKKIVLPFKYQKSFFETMWKKEKPAIVIKILKIFFDGINVAFCAYCTKQFIDIVISDKNFYGAMLYIVIMIIFLAMSRGVTLLEANLTGVAMEKIKNAVKEEFYLEFSKVQYSFFDNADNKDYYEFIVKYLDSCGVGLYDLSTQVLTSIVSLVGMLMVLPVLPWWIYVLLIALSTFRFINNVFRSKKESEYKVKRVPYARRREYYVSLIKDSNKLFDLNTNGAVRGILGRLHETLEEYLILVKGYNKNKARHSLYAFFSYPVQNIILYSYAAVRLLGSSMTVGEYTLLFRGVDKISQVIEHLLMVPQKYVPYIYDTQNYLKGIEAVRRHREIFDESCEISQIKKIEFKNVGFHYENNTSFSLKDFSFVFNAGEKIAIVGINGSGKSTLIKLLLKFYIPNEGEVLINGVNIKCISREQLSKLTGCVFQESHAYALTLEENVGISALGNIDKEKVIKSMENTFLDFKYSNMLEEDVTRKFSNKGLVFSGGEMQKLAIARLIYKNPDVIILDEPTSALDPLSEKNIIDKMYELSENKILIYVTHRLSNCVDADKIIVINQGKIENIGRHDELLKISSNYREMFHRQAEGYRKG